VSAGKVIDVTTFLPEDWLAKQYNKLAGHGTIDGIEAGVFHRFNGKSLAGIPEGLGRSRLRNPRDMDELMALNQQIADDGDTAWCIGIESGAATGWTATDWTEEMMLRTTSLENYDAWVAGTLPFDSPEVKKRSRPGASCGSMMPTYTAALLHCDDLLWDSPGPMFDDRQVLDA